ncbi:protein kinase [Bacillus tianshenii]|uniref:protein kinase domain-containing protein n=1 Tax=Sutcliffiella tianshenii TaxID=1463404 RepID=UPI001CD1AAFD|nr:protein kinase [Bacillus tianshenii]MCA1321680.1 protein kinase [Bacillus tianshenii]
MEPHEQRCLGCMSGKEGQSPCPHCGWIDGTLPDSPQHLVPGTILQDKYLVGRVLGQGGFGITYIGWDLQLDMKLAIKEYMPRDFASRNSGEAEVTFYTGNVKTHFVNGMNKFLEEAKILAKYNNQPGIVSVRDFFKENGTAYLVMYYLEGIDLKKYLEQFGGRLPYEQGLAIMVPVMEALATVHKDGILHRDISPDNIYITMQGEVKLLDFGAARHAVSDSNKSLSVILKPGYAPEEQYRSKGNQGPWTDIYGLAATFYRVLTGKVPPESLDRLDEETLIPPSRLGVAIPPHAEAAILKALSIRSQDRFPSMGGFQQALLQPDSNAFMTPVNNAQVYTTPISNTSPANDPKTVPLLKQIEASSAPKKNKNLLIFGLSFVGSIVIFFLFFFLISAFGDDETKKVDPVPNPGPGPVEPDKPDDPVVDPPEQVTVPNVLALTEEEAIAALEAAGLTVGAITTEENLFLEKGYVLEQSVVAEEQVEGNSPIDLIISVGVELPVDVNVIYEQGMSIIQDYLVEGDTYYNNGQLEDALKSYTQGRNMARELYAYNQSPDARFAEAIVTNSMAEIKAKLDYPYFALEDSMESVSILTELNNPAYNVYLAQAYTNLAWHQILNQKPEESVTSSQQAMGLDPNNNFSTLNLAHGLLLTDYFADAFRFYRQVIQNDVNGIGMTDIIAEDLVILGEAGYTHPDMKEINEILLGNMPDDSEQSGIERTIYYQAYSELANDFDGFMSAFYYESPQYSNLYTNYESFYNTYQILSVEVVGYTINQITNGEAWVSVSKKYTYTDGTNEVDEEVTFEMVMYAMMGSHLDWQIAEFNVAGE